ncbi:DICT sensory domain-containing protein [Myxacorys almedinensis]|uniref:Metal-dependent phosphohydrolase n=1 Tax=Myxacorys almedinensis A TaxID=2690445 RepID=A0A8J8CJ23_9CYAN|nr:DICT sensory domain-containing protein [Myxacorys almedinensis]NDJ18214.1 metal-dependent phosphohydrolase [Myxacorys almedinensis A]
MLEGSILHHLKLTHQPDRGGKRSLNFGVYYKNTLVSLCHALEDCILTCTSAPLVITAFQRGKWYLEEADRYAELADRAQRVVILASPDTGFAEHPTSQKANVDLVALEKSDPVAQEWHLMIFAPTYTAMVLCQEISAEDYGTQGLPKTDLERKFYGFWTFEAELVRETVEIAIAHVDHYNPDLANQLRSQVETIAADAQQRDRDEVYTAVSRVIDYLQTGQQTLSRSQEGLDNNLVSNELQAFLRLAQLIDQTDISNPMAAAEVATLAEAMGQLLDLPVWQMNRLRLAGLLHRLGVLQSDSVLSPSSFGHYSEDPPVPLSCPIVPGAQILRTMQRLKAIATIITHQTERWDGQGQPAGLAGDEIPLESRILGLLVEFQQRVAEARLGKESLGETGLRDAFAACQAEASDRWDPKLVEALALLVSAMQQGMNLSVSLPKIASSMWLLDSHSDDDLLNLNHHDSSKAVSDTNQEVISS